MYPPVQNQGTVSLRNLDSIHMNFGRSHPAIAASRIMAGIALAVAACTQPQERDALSECPECPTMIRIPAGSFAMGTAEKNLVLNPRSGKLNTNETPQHDVTFAEAFWLSQHEITVEQFAAFSEASGYVAAGGCLRLDRETLKLTTDENSNWQNPGFEQQADEPVVCVSFLDAAAYANWLSDKTGQPYHVPTEAQWEYATRAGSAARFFWGDNPQDGCEFANVRKPADSDENACDDGFDGIAPAGSLRANTFGVHDMLGNVWEWTMDCSHPNYEGAPVDGSAWLEDKDCLFRIIRGGSYSNPVTRSGSAIRAGRPQSGTAPNLGFRIARSNLAPAVESTVAITNQITTEGENSRASQLFSNHCAACHMDAATFKAVYGTDQEAVANTIRSGGNNTMSMPNFEGLLSEADIQALAEYIRKKKGWD
jgi:formylglycine-generating enzyme required for sulfatase activity